jgi:hypothetical protein
MTNVHRASSRPVNESCPLKAMAKHILLYGSLSLLIIAGLMGCASPKSNPAAVQPEFREGTPLDMSSTHVTPASMPYVVSQDWTIPQNTTVTIDPGTVIMFDSLWSVFVDGRIIARGTASRPIIFTSAHLNPVMGQWRGFVLRNPNAADTSIFVHCIFSWGAYYDTDTTSVYAVKYRGMLAIDNSSPWVERCVLVRNQNNAIYMTGASAPHIRYNIFTKNDASAVRADTTVPLPSFFEEPGYPDISYNCVGDNSAISFLMGLDSTSYGRKLQTNENLDSCDQFYNIDMAPLFQFQLAGSDVYPATWAPDGSDFALQSCSPCIDAGPVSRDLDAEDNTRADMGTEPYLQFGGELRGVVNGDLQSSIAYRMSCDVRINAGTVLRIPAGTQIETTGLYTIQVYGKLIVDGALNSHVRIAPGVTGGDLWGGIVFYNQDTLISPSEVRGLDAMNFRSVVVRKPGIVFEHCLFDHGLNYGVEVYTQQPDMPDTVRFANCTFNACGLFGIAVDSSAATIRNCVVTACAGRGIWLLNTGDAAAITNTAVYANAAIGLGMQDFCSPVVTNSVFAYNAYYGIEMENNCNPEIQNTIVYRNTNGGIRIIGSSQPVLEYNDVNGHLGRDYLTADAQHPAPIDSTSISQDPLFISTTDFHLGTGSPCINAGNPDQAYNDPDGTANGLTNDMGVFGGPNSGSGVGSSTMRQLPRGLASK